MAEADSTHADLHADDHVEVSEAERRAADFIGLQAMVLEWYQNNASNVELRVVIAEFLERNTTEDQRKALDQGRLTPQQLFRELSEQLPHSSENVSASSSSLSAGNELAQEPDTIIPVEYEMDDVVDVHMGRSSDWVNAFYRLDGHVSGLTFQLLNIPRLFVVICIGVVISLPFWFESNAPLELFSSPQRSPRPNGESGVGGEGGDLGSTPPQVTQGVQEAKSSFQQGAERNSQADRIRPRTSRFDIDPLPSEVGADTADSPEAAPTTESTDNPDRRLNQEIPDVSETAMPQNPLAEVAELLDLNNVSDAMLSLSSLAEDVQSREQATLRRLLLAEALLARNDKNSRVLAWQTLVSSYDVQYARLIDRQFARWVYTSTAEERQKILDQESGRNISHTKAILWTKVRETPSEEGLIPALAEATASSLQSECDLLYLAIARYSAGQTELGKADLERVIRLLDSDAGDESVAGWLTNRTAKELREMANETAARM